MIKEFVIESTEAMRIMMVTDIHHCQKEWYETSSDDRMKLMCEAINEEYNKRPFDCIISLGDYSLDFWKWGEGGSYLWENPVSYTSDFVKRYLPQLPTRMFMIPGNHEQYGNDDWEKITGFPREYVVVYGDNVFVMEDTFAGDLDPKENHDGVYTGLNTGLLNDVLEKYPNKRIFICAHDLMADKEGCEVKEIISGNKRIVCAFTGHTHCDNTVILPDDMRNMPVFYCGDFSYNASRDKEKNWGYRIVELKEDSFSTEYVRI